MRRVQDLYPSDLTFECGVTIQYKNKVLKSVLKDSSDRHKSQTSTKKKTKSQTTQNIDLFSKDISYCHKKGDKNLLIFLTLFGFKLGRVTCH